MVLDEEKLINLISQYPELYDLQHEHYMNTGRKNNIWKEVAKELGEKDPTVCKDKWKSLRDSYHRNVKRRKCKSGDGATKSKKWKFESQMEFLRLYLQERPTKSNIESAPMSDDDDNDTNESYVPDAMPTSPEPVTSPLSSSSATSVMFKSITARKKKQTQSTQQSSVASVLQNYLDSRPVSTPAIDSGSPMHSFFKAMADSAIALPPDLQLKIKNKVYAIVSDAEYENITRNSASFADQLNKTTPSTSSQFLETHLTPRPRCQNSQDQQVQNVSDNVQHQIENITNAKTNGIHDRRNNQSHIVVDLNSVAHTNYVITEDGTLVPQEITYD